MVLSEQAKAYTHGLEQIYKLENVDIRTVRPLKQAKKEEVESPPLVVEEEQTTDLELDLGEGFREWMPSVILQEPLRVLNLSQQAARTLEEHGLRQIKDIISKAPEDFIFLKGLGQGHIDEILQKLREYVGGKSLDRVTHVDMAGFLRCLLSKQSNKEAVLLVESYGLAHLFQPTSGEEAELRHLSKEQKGKLVEQAKEALHQERGYFEAELSAIAAAFLIPWMKRRLGIATEGELLERLEKVASDASLVSASLSFFSDHFCDGKPPFIVACREVDGGYAASDAIAERVSSTVACAESYFYGESIAYPLDELSSLIEREQARQWVESDEGFVEKVLRYTPRFQLYRDRRGTLWVGKR